MKHETDIRLEHVVSKDHGTIIAHEKNINSHRVPQTALQHIIGKSKLVSQKNRFCSFGIHHAWKWGRMSIILLVLRVGLRLGSLLNVGHTKWLLGTLIKGNPYDQPPPWSTLSRKSDIELYSPSTLRRTPSANGDGYHTSNNNLKLASRTPPPDRLLCPRKFTQGLLDQRVIQCQQKTSFPYIFPSGLKRSAIFNLDILLVCRQFKHDFARLAWEKTTFIPPGNVASVQVHILQCVRKLIISEQHLYLKTWESYPFNIEALQLDYLSLTVYQGLVHDEIAQMLRRLKNVKVFEFLLLHTGAEAARFRYDHLVTALIREDWDQRYGANNMPNIGNAWWSWKFHRAR